ncbi:hypothetical protein LPJ75_002425, partial [Coemansia sp. RSA 2598]
MLLFTDILTGDELFSDAYPLKEAGGAFEVDCQMITIGAVQVDTGANQSAEDPEEALDDSAETVNNVVYSFRLVQTQFDKKSYMTYIKGYMKELAAKLAEVGKSEEEIENFKKEAATLVKKILGDFKNY